MKGTESKIICPFLLKFYISRDHIYNVIPCAHFFYDIFRIIHEALLSLSLSSDESVLYLIGYALMHLP